MSTSKNTIVNINESSRGNPTESSDHASISLSSSKASNVFIKPLTTNSHHSGIPRLQISSTTQHVPPGYSHIPQSRTTTSRQTILILAGFGAIVAVSLIGLAVALYTHPAWGRTFEKRLPEILQQHHEHRQRFQNGAVVPIAHEFQLKLPAGYDVAHKGNSKVSPVPWLPSFRKKKSGVEKIHFRDQSIPPRVVSWSVVSEGKPRALLINGTLTPEEAQSIIDVSAKSLARSRVIAGNNGEEAPNSVRTSMGMFMTSEEERNLRANRILREIAAAMGGIPQDDWVEATQVLRYQKGQRYLAHPDFYDQHDQANLNRGGQRIYTVLTWLNEVKIGGSTTFPYASLSVQPHTFGSIMFYDVDVEGNVDFASQHSGDPPGEGSTKVVAVNWCHGMPFY